MFFIGNLNANRVGLYHYLKGIKYTPKNFLVRRIYSRLLRDRIQRNVSNKFNFSVKFPKSYLAFTPGFAKGLSQEEYVDQLVNSKIVLCPKGFVSPETIRHVEAMMAGCVIISEKLPETYIYKNAPIMVVDHWSEIDKIIERLLYNPDLMTEIHEKTLWWWENICSERAYAQYIKEKIEQLEGEL